jgi:hypothetical protein
MVVVFYQTEDRDPWSLVRARCLSASSRRRLHVGAVLYAATTQRPSTRRLHAPVHCSGWLAGWLAAECEGEASQQIKTPSIATAPD